MIEKELKLYMPLIRFDTLVSRKARNTTQKALKYILLLLALALAGLVVYDSVRMGSISFTGLVGEFSIVTGIFLVVVGPYFLLLGLSFFFNTYYYRGLNQINHESHQDTYGVTYEVATLVSRHTHDLTRAFLEHPYGQDIMVRSGIMPSQCDVFIETEREQISANDIVLKNDGFITLSDIARFIITQDAQFKDFVFTHSVTEEQFIGAADWVTRAQVEAKLNERWWSKDNLSKTTGLGRELSFGVAYKMQRFMRDLGSTTVLSTDMSDLAYADEIIKEIEAILVRDSVANVLLIGEAGVGKMDMLIELGRRIQEGKTIASLKAKRIIVFDTNAFTAVHNSKQSFEIELLELMSQAERAGEMVVVIEDYPQFIASCEAIGVNINELLERYFTSPHIQFVITTNPSTYHQSLETNQGLVRQFSQVTIEDADLLATVRVLQAEAPEQEHLHKIVFTYSALEHIVENADRYIVEGVMPDKALAFMGEIASLAGQRNEKLVTADFVDVHTSKKTGIPTGPIQEEEKDLLLNLETVLHGRVVGQDDAIQAIASTMRRARTGIQNEKRPMGSFLFLGPTGVGKTETAKALAHVFFEGAENMVRLDMSEFSDEVGLERLIGSNNEPGVLSSTLREHPYCVLLLDEFEKASTEVHDLFLQILDEGVVTDARGQKINARNTIIVATSNAGSEMIWDLVQEGERPGDHEDKIIDKIIDTHTFKPELINRFDAAVIFESLSSDQQEKIAGLMLNALKERIKDKGYVLEIDSNAINKLVTAGYDPKFGARPMRRVIQDVVEEKIARKIIEGSLQKGDTIRLEEGDIAQ